MSLFTGPAGKPNTDALDFATLIAPMEVETFFSDYYDKKPVHIEGGADKFAELMNWPVLTGLLNMTGIWSSQSLMLQLDRQTLPPRAYCDPVTDRSGNSVMQPNAAKVMDLLQNGASLVANDIDTLTRELSLTANCLEDTFDAKVQVNLYCSWKQRQAFNSHFDTHDVFALHAEGEKVWRVYETRMPHPIRHARFENDAFQEPQHEQQRGKLMMEVTMKPGDILYLPRGWYHDALASSGGSVHMAFGVVGLTGFDVVGALSDFAVNDELFRRNLPIASDGRDAMKAAIQALGRKLADLAQDDALVDSVIAYQRSYRYPRMGIDLPVTPIEQHYRVTAPGLRVERRGNQSALMTPRGPIPIPPGRDGIVGWIVSRPAFDRSAYLDAHAALPVADLDRVLMELMNMGLLAQEGVGNKGP